MSSMDFNSNNEQLRVNANQRQNQGNSQYASTTMRTVDHNLMNQSQINDPNMSIMPLENATSDINRQIQTQQLPQRRTQNRNQRHHQNQASIATVQSQQTTQSRRSRFRRGRRSRNNLSNQRNSMSQNRGNSASSTNPSQITQPSNTEENMIRNTTDDDHNSNAPPLERINPYDQEYENRQQYEQLLIDDNQLRLFNITEQLENFQLYFLVYTIFIATLLIQLVFLQHLKIQLAFCVLILFHAIRVIICARRIIDRKINQNLPWMRFPNILRAVENGMYTLIWTLVLFYISFKGQIHISGLGIAIPAVIACSISCFCIRYEETPCNATMQLMTKVIIVLRLLIGFSALLKLDKQTQWDWSTTFWPYWCSFAIQGIMGIASLIIFLNTALNYLKEESTLDDILASFWAFIVCGGFVVSTLLPIVSVIQIYDQSPNDPSKNLILSHDDLQSQVQPLSVQKIGFEILKFPLIYTVFVSIMTLILKRQIMQETFIQQLSNYSSWFEHVLYIDEDDQSQYMMDEENEQQSVDQDEQEIEKTVHIRTYKFKTPQFIVIIRNLMIIQKKLTNTYFKKSRKEEKMRILRRDMLRNLEDAKISHKKNKSESYSKPHKREFSMFEQNSPTKVHQQKKPSKNFQQEDEFFEFQDNENQNQLELNAGNSNFGQKAGVGTKKMSKKNLQRFMSQDFRQEQNQQINSNNSSNRGIMKNRQDSINRLSVSLQQKECCICFDSKPDAVIMECGHGGICYECGKHMIATEPRVCHLCREGIAYILKMDLSTVYSNFIKVISATFIDDDSEEQNNEENKDNPPEQNEQQNQRQDHNQLQAQINSMNQSNNFLNQHSRVGSQINNQQLQHQRQKSITVQLDNSIQNFAHQRGNSMLIQQKQNDDSTAYFMQNPFYRELGGNTMGLNGKNQTKIIGNGIMNEQDVIEFVSPRPNEEEEKMDEEVFQSSFGANGQMNVIGAYVQFRDIQEEIKEEEDENEYSEQKIDYFNMQSPSNSGIKNNKIVDLEEYKKQLSNRKFKLFQVQKKPSQFYGQSNNDLGGGGNFYQFENISNPDSIVLSARSGRLSNLEQNDTQNDFNSSQKFNSSIGFNIFKGGRTSLRESFKSSQDLANKIKVHKKPNNRGGSIYLVEEFLSTNINNPLTNANPRLQSIIMNNMEDAGQQQFMQQQNTSLNAPNI